MSDLFGNHIVGFPTRRLRSLLLTSTFEHRKNFIMAHHISILRPSKVQVNLIITLSLGSMKTDRVISEPCYNKVIIPPAKRSFRGVYSFQPVRHSVIP